MIVVSHNQWLVTIQSILTFSVECSFSCSTGWCFNCTTLPPKSSDCQLNYLSLILVSHYCCHYCCCFDVGIFVIARFVIFVFLFILLLLGSRVWCVEVYQSSYIIIIQLKYVLTVVDLTVCISETNNNIWKVFSFWWQWFAGCLTRTSRSCGTDEGQRSGLSWKASAVPAGRDLLHCSSFCSTTWSVFPRLAVWTSSTKVPTSLYLGGC